MNPNDQPDEEQKRKKSAIDYANQGINKGRDAYNTYQKVQGVVRLARGAQATAEGAEAASAGISAASSGPVAIIIILLLLIITMVVVIFGGGAQAVAAPTCTGITSSSTSVSPTTPITLTEDGCSGTPVYTWTSTDAGGIFSAPSGASTTFTPSAAATGTITITMSACSGQGQCNQYNLQVTFTASLSTCKALGGQCTTAALCGAEGVPGNQTIPAGLADCRQNGSSNVCCNIPNGIYFLCQYGGVNAAGQLNDRGKWNTKSCNIEGGGCGPTTVAMILDSFTGALTYTPTQVALANKGYGCNPKVGSDLSDFRTWIGIQGYRVTGDLVNGANKIDLTLAKKYIDQGYLILGEAYITFAGNAGIINRNHAELHAFLISDVDVANQSITVYDPTFCEGGFRGGKRIVNNVNTFSKNNDIGSPGWTTAAGIIKK